MASGGDGRERGGWLNDDFHRKLLAETGLKLGDDINFEAIDEPANIIDDV